MISKKNIRYLGTLYSINEQNATVALQNVKSFGTEGRPTDTPVAPSDDVHPFLLFRGQDITDLHVHEDQPKSTTGTANTTNTPAPPAPAPAPAPPKQTPEQKKNAAKAALRRQLEQTLLQIPPPRPPPADWNAIPNVNSIDFMMLVGLDEVVDTILSFDSKPTLKNALEELRPFNPRICAQCKVDFSPCWKAAKGSSVEEYVLCENCSLQNVKKELKAEHTSRLKSAFMKALKQEQDDCC